MSGYGFHLTDNRAGLPKRLQVETGAVSESPVLDERVDRIPHIRGPVTLTDDDSYTRASRMRQWAKQGVRLLIKWP